MSCFKIINNYALWAQDIRVVGNCRHLGKNRYDRWAWWNRQFQRTCELHQRIWRHQCLVYPLDFVKEEPQNRVVPGPSQLYEQFFHGNCFRWTQQCEHQDCDQVYGHCPVLEPLSSLKILKTRRRNRQPAIFTPSILIREPFFFYQFQQEVKIKILLTCLVTLVAAKYSFEAPGNQSIMIIL